MIVHDIALWGSDINGERPFVAPTSMLSLHCIGGLTPESTPSPNPLPVLIHTLDTLHYLPAAYCWYAKCMSLLCDVPLSKRPSNVCCREGFSSTHPFQNTVPPLLLSCPPPILFGLSSPGLNLWYSLTALLHLNQPSWPYIAHSSNTSSHWSLSKHFW